MTRANYIELNKTIKPMNKNTVKSIERNSARFIYVDKNKNAKCERCNNEFALETKHLSHATCPICKLKATVIHSFRRHNNESIHWEVVTNAINESMLVFRYYLVIRVDGQITESAERARYFLNAKEHKEFKMEFSKWDNDWTVSGRRFFREWGMGYTRNSLCCLDATVRGEFFREVQKLDALKYIDVKALWSNNYYPTSVGYIIRHADLYEKLQKIGFNDLIRASLNNYTPSLDIAYNKAKTEITKMLGINKNALALLKTRQTLNALKVLQNLDNLNEREFNAFCDYSLYEIEHIKTIAQTINVSAYKVANYATSQGISVNELSRYHDKLSSLNYNLKDKSYAMPKDFNKEVARLIEEEKKAKAEFEEKKNQLIKAIHDKLNSTEELKQYFKGAHGFMAYVPMSEQEFIDEGKAQHNCVGRGHYAESVAKNQTLVFFIRELHNPSAPFVTMEYCNGTIVQCMYDHNKRVDHNAKVYNFCSALANTLNECKILSA